MGFYEYYLTEATNPRLDRNANIEANIEAFMSKNQSQIEKWALNFKSEIIRARPNMGQTLSNWWGNLKDFGHKLWTGKWKEWQEGHVYDAKLYNLLETTVNSIYNETNATNIDGLIAEFMNKLINLFKLGMKSLAAQNYERGLQHGYIKGKGVEGRPEPEVKQEPPAPAPAAPAPAPAAPAAKPEPAKPSEEGLTPEDEEELARLRSLLA